MNNSEWKRFCIIRNVFFGLRACIHSQFNNDRISNIFPVNNIDRTDLLVIEKNGADEVHLLLNSLFLIAGVKWGDWKRWNNYHSTILFFWFGDLLYNVLCKNYLMWEYKETIFGQNLLPNHLAVSLLIMFVAYPATVIIYLGNIPRGTFRIVLWLLFWVTLYSLVEYINLRYFNLVSHHHGWSMGWSVLFNFIIFSMLLVHFKRPITALILSAPIILFFVIYFNVPIN